MARITLNELNETMEEIPAKLMLIINVTDNAETHAQVMLRHMGYLEL